MLAVSSKLTHQVELKPGVKELGLVTRSQFLVSVLHYYY